MAKKRKIEIKHEPVSEPEPEEQEEAPLYEDDDQNEESEEQEEEQQQPDIAAADDDEGGEGNGSGDGSGEASEDENEPVHKLLEPFSKEQLIDLLVEASTSHPDVLDRVTKIADVDPVHRKIFVHGLGWDTTSETLTSIFTKYGEIEECKAVVDKISGKSKGYGFILFKHRKGARKALVEPQKRIGSRMTACQLASAGPVPPPMPAASEYTQRKIFVSNVSADIDPHKLASYFAKYGEIEEGPLGLDKQTGKPKGFALFVYKSVESSRKALEEPHKNFEGHILHCQKAIDGPKPNKTHSHQHMNTHHHGGSHRNDTPNFMGGGGVGNQMSAVNVMNPPQSAMPFNQGTPQVAGVNPLSQAVAALLASQGTGFGLTNLLGTLGSQGMTPQVNQNTPVPMGNNPGAGMQGGYGNQQNMGGYGTPTPIQGGYSNQSVGQQSTGRPQQGMGHVAGPYMGH